MMQGVFITGTGTSVGKTHIGVLLAKQLHELNIKVIPRKPIESGCIKVGDELIPADATALKQASGYEGPLSEICPYRFEPPISPARAAHLANKVLTTEQLASICLDSSNDGFVLVEGAGGFYSPLSENGLNADLAVALQLPVLLVTNDILGCLNQVLLNVEAIEMRGLHLAGVVLNSLAENDNHLMDNAADLRTRLKCPVFTHAFGNDSELSVELVESIKSQPDYGNVTRINSK